MPKKIWCHVAKRLETGGFARERTLQKNSSTCFCNSPIDGRIPKQGFGWNWPHGNDSVLQPWSPQKICMQPLFNLYLKRCIGIAKTSCPGVPQGAQSNQHCSPHRGGWKGHLSWRMKPGSLFGLQALDTLAFPKPLPQATPWLPPKHLRSSYSELWVKLALGKKGRSQPIHFFKINMASVGLNEPGRPPALSITNGATSEAKPIWARITWPAHTAYTHMI